MAIITNNRWWVYQRERFPILAHAPLVAAFSFSALCYSSLLRGDITLPLLMPALVAFVSALLFFLLLRIADEFKDFEDDCRYRPYRPVPRGLVTLNELAIIAIAALLIQLVLALWLHTSLVIILLLVWCYLALMSKEFFVHNWLKARPILYMLSHMLIMPLIDLYATACDWLVAGEGLPDGLYWFLLVSFFNGMVIEIGRKIRAPHDEEPGVETYTVLWGKQGAVFAWLMVLMLTTACALMAAWQIDFLLPAALLMTGLLFIAGILSLAFIKKASTQLAKKFELVSGLWTLLMYLSLGAVPLAWSVWSL